MKTKLLFYSAIVIVITVVINCSKKDDNTESTTESPYAGNWTGNYGNGTYGISFVVSDDGQIKDLYLTDYASCGWNCPDGGGELTISKPVKINSDGTFYAKPYFNDKANGVISITDSISAKFIDSNTLEGKFSSAFVLMNCGMCFGGGVGMTNFTASKGCDKKPKKGKSATRFCN